MVGDYGFLDVALPDAYNSSTVIGNARFIDQTIADGKRTHSSSQVAAVAAPVDEGLVDGDLAEEVIHIVIGPLAFGEDDGFAGAGCGAAHAVSMLAIRIGAADNAQQ